MDTVKTLTNYFNAGYPCLSINTQEEIRAQGDVVNAARQANKTIYTWSATEGVIELATGAEQDGTKEFIPACEFFTNKEVKDSVFILRDIHLYPFQDPNHNRSLRDLITDAPSRGCCTVLIQPDFTPPETVKSMVTKISYTLPDNDTLRRIAKSTVESAAANGKKVKPASDEVIKALSGLSTIEAENALALSLVEKGEFNAEVIYREKVTAINKDEKTLKLIDPDPRGLAAIGGLENFKAWIQKRKIAYSEKAKAYGLPAPKGVLLTGLPGCGKSLSATAIGTALGIPTLRLDIGALFGGIVGTTETNLREALKLAEALAPCVVWVDEVEKALAGSRGSGDNTGISQRLFGDLLTWMQERKRPVFLIMTANQVNLLDPAFLRKGRFDEIFFVDLPHAIEREQITKVILKKHSRDAKDFDLAAIAAATKDFSGSEIECVIEDALFSSFDENERPLETKDILAAAATTIPQAKMSADSISAIRAWGADKAKPASRSPEQEPQQQQTGRKLKF